MTSKKTYSKKVALVTGAAQRIGAAICQALHNNGYRVIIHYRHSQEPAKALAEQLNKRREDSAYCLAADLNDISQTQHLATQAIEKWGGLDLLVNNASTFYASNIGKVDAAQWQDLMASNLTAPFFLSQALADALTERQGNIVNIVDVHAEQPLQGYSVYCIAKAGLSMMTKSLAKELGPQVRVNAIAPGAILWPDDNSAKDNSAYTETEKNKVLKQIPLQRLGNPEDIAKSVLFLTEHAPYVTGQILAVDGGRSVYG